MNPPQSNVEAPSEPPVRTDEPVTKRPKRGKNKNRFMRVVRRIHLYSGLVLILPILVYGLSAVLFNHPGLLSDVRSEDVDRADFADTVFAEPLDPDEAAAMVVAAAAEEGFELKLAEPARAEFEGLFRFEANDAEARWRVFFRPEEEGAWMRRRPADIASDQAPFARGRFAVAFPWMDGITDDGFEILEDLGAGEIDEMSYKVPKLDFDVLVDGERWRATYDVARRRLSGVEIGTSQGLGPRDFLLQMHLAHSYAGTAGYTKIWAILVDIMGGVMVLWAGSGLLMWWQMKRLRFAGGVVLVLGIALFAALATGMYDKLG